ncbi:hypothetical protein AMR41_19900 [Hapalosiphon sp. MRB220]|nr:hypothetical protein AMR41_19900 [Hapalosiphon sp. MRB220]
MKDSSKCKGDILRGDYHRSAVNRAGGSDTIVLAIHAGEIETNTGEIAGAISGNNKWDFYTFVGHIKNQACKDLKPGSDKPNYDVLHITSTTFNDPIAIKKVNAHEKTISIHGHGKSHADGSICVGGLNDAQRKEFINYVNDNKASFKLYSLNPIDAPNKTSGDCSEDVLKGTDPDNIVNKNKSKKGLQLELNLQMRKDLVNPDANYDELRKIFYQGLKQAMSK